MAVQLDVPWHAVHVDTPTLQGRTQAQRQQPLRVLKLAEELGASTASLAAPDAAQALVGYARKHNLSRLLVGRSRRRWRWPWKHTLTERIASLADDLDLMQVALPPAPPHRSQSHHRGAPPHPIRLNWSGYGGRGGGLRPDGAALHSAARFFWS